ncbi:hypothetical protein Phum_PHUM294330 [Pediculus humanus corporis]|uniref:Uncharacterized protein n=1 Tax=Pediculus humanus subsp. corporis TaxID=121224 RepID=E0VLU7_PEDHC|nr:uncharacterized protein Phum_PHUM294330 [Pediculus humanus corporis]EEB14353.1 hypothetical protein Phum_PHUM294330 [Pediculus humanus corporis]
MCDKICFNPCNDKEINYQKLVDPFPVGQYDIFMSDAIQRDYLKTQKLKYREVNKCCGPMISICPPPPIQCCIPMQIKKDPPLLPPSLPSSSSSPCEPEMNLYVHLVLPKQE